MDSSFENEAILQRDEVTLLAPGMRQRGGR